MERFIPYHKSSSHAKTPTYANHDDAGLDLYAPTGGTIDPGDWAVFSTLLSMAIPEGYVGMICPRSGLAIEHGITVLNSPGIVDSGYRGDIAVALINHGHEPYAVEDDDRIAQLVIVPKVYAQLGERNIHHELRRRSTNGFGASGR